MTIKIQFNNESFEMKNALIAGRNDDYFGSPTSCYIGSLNPDEIHSALYFTHRAVIRLLCDQFNVPLDEVDDFLLSALSEALTKEYNNRIKGEDDMDVRKTVKYNKKNQK
jgi:hypothetical protein